MKSFAGIARNYDLFNGADYDAYADFVKKAFRQSAVAVKEVLDLGCGTGELSIRLADAGFSVTAVDVSEDMLSVLTGKKGERDILVLREDMRKLDLYGTVQGAVSSFDVLNYLTSAKDLDAALGRVGLFMEKGGIFVFDINTDHTYDNLYARRAYVYEEEDAMLVWQNAYHPKTRLCRFYLTLFQKGKDGAYTREDTLHVQKNHAQKTVRKAAAVAGFDILGAYGDLNFKTPEKTDPKAYFVLRKNRSL